MSRLIYKKIVFIFKKRNSKMSSTALCPLQVAVLRGNIGDTNIGNSHPLNSHLNAANIRIQKEGNTFILRLCRT